NATGVPSEVRPLVESLNQLFARTHAMMVRERRFTSDDKDQWRFVWMTSPDGNIASLLVRNGNTVKTWRWRLLPGN
ncbi:hypothetical protein, partial [Streptococcus pneumoniae]|uniref:hypothetical protein n=1 Tax=Streptococcus pneumoniae TaxID=1313 RepID=UPI001BB136BB